MGLHAKIRHIVLKKVACVPQKIGVPAVRVVDSSVVALQRHGLDDGVVVDIGLGCTRVTPVLNGAMAPVQSPQLFRSSFPFLLSPPSFLRLPSALFTALFPSDLLLSFSFSICLPALAFGQRRCELISRSSAARSTRPRCLSARPTSQTCCCKSSVSTRCT